MIRKKEHKMNCVMCDDEFTTYEWIETKGILKGHKIVAITYCSPACQDKFEEFCELV